MSVTIITVLDIQAETFLVPQFTHNKATAKRLFAQAVNEPGHDFNRHPESYSLYKIGEYNEETGLITPCDPEHLALAETVKAQSNEE